MAEEEDCGWDFEKSRTTNIIKDSLDVSYEPSETWEGDDEHEKEIFPERAVLLVTRCCKINHDHITLDKEQAMALAEWLVAFANGEYDE